MALSRPNPFFLNSEAGNKYKSKPISIDGILGSGFA
jgi:hypothetical protein